MSDFQLVIAIDFGTHASGFAWAEASERTKPLENQLVVPFRDWPDEQSFKYFKTRTALLRSDSGKIIAYGNKASLEYGRRRRQGEEHSVRLKETFKLDLASSDSAVREEAIRDAVDYLSWLRKTALDATARYVRRVPEDGIRWCITTPVVVVEELSGYDSILRNRVAEPAGFPADDREKLVLVPEPEAAALYWQVEGAAVGGRFTVVDAGGGTVDITTLAVNKYSTLDQIGFQAGGKLGSRSLDARFRALVLSCLKKDHGWQEATSPNPEDWATIMSKWEEDKRSWDFADHQQYFVRIPRRTGEPPIPPATVSTPPFDGSLLLGDEILNQVFEPLIGDILGEFDNALADLPEGPAIGQVLLVGGFGGSPYLQRRLREHIGDRASLTTMEDPKAAEAVLRGAALYALNPELIRARRMQYTYGFEYHAACGRPHEKHPTEHRRVRRSTWSRTQESCAQLCAFAQRGEVVEAGTIREISAVYPVDHKDRQVLFQVYASTELDPYFVENCTLLGGVNLPVRTRWWQSTSRRPIDVKVALGETELIFYAVDRRRPEFHREIKLDYFEGPDDDDL